MGDTAGLFDEQDNADDLGFGFNKDFADRLEHNKQREELHRLRERHPELAARLELQGQRELAQNGEIAGGSSEDDEEEEEDEGDQPLQADRKFLELLVKIRRRDPSLYTSDDPASGSSGGDSETDSEDERAEPPRAAKRSHQPKFLKDVLADQALADGAGDSSDEQEQEEPAAEGTYVQEQQELRDAFLQAAEDSAAVPEQSNFGGMLLKSRARQAAHRQELSQLVDQAYDAKSYLNKDDQFLRSFLLNEGWKDKGDREEALEVQDADMAEDDDAFDEAAEQFEAQYNFRFEEEGADRIRSYPRVLEGTLRRVDDTRKRARDRQTQRHKAQREQHDNEVRRLKRLRRQEIQDKLQQLQEVAGSNAPTLDVMDKLMAGDFDADEYDAAMNAAFGQDYYEREGDGSEPEDMPQDLLDDPPLQGNEADAAAKAQGFAAVHASLMGAGSSAAAQKSAAEVKRLLERYHDLEYEDHVGGIATRFKYQEVPRADYGLEIGELLALPDKELNQVVGLKRLAPYRDDAGLSRPNFGKLRELRAAKPARSSAGGDKAVKQKRPRMQLAAEEPIPDQPFEQPAVHQSHAAADAANADESHPAEVGPAAHEAHAQQEARRLTQLRAGDTDADETVQNGARKRKRKKGTAGAFGRNATQSHTNEAAISLPLHRLRDTGAESLGHSSAQVAAPAARPQAIIGKDGAHKRQKTGAAAVHSRKSAPAAAENHLEQSQADAEAAALERRRKTYEQPFLTRKPGQADQSRRNKDRQRDATGSDAPVLQQEVQEDGGALGLSRAQKRNARRARIRQSKQGSASTPA